MAGGAEWALAGVLGKELQAAKNHAIVPLRVVDELKRHVRSGREPQKRFAGRGLRIVERMRKRGVAVIYGDANDSFADSTLLNAIGRAYMRHNVVLVTEDKNLRKDCLAIRQRQSVQSRYSLHVLRIEDFKGRQSKHRSWRFERPGKVEGGKPKQLTVHQLPASGGVVRGKSGDMILGTLVGRGGEGCVYQTDRPDILCKVFHADRITDVRREKLRLMTSKDTEFSRICWPIESVTNQAGEFVGYTMKAAEGVAIAKSLFLPQVLKRRFGSWNRSTLAKVALNVARAVATLHHRGVIVGDLNPQNILVGDNAEVWIVDCDSFQVGGHTCPVGMRNFMAPELHNVDLSRTLRQEKHDNFALASLIFMILMPGKPPYSQQGGGDPAENIRKGQFPYPVGQVRPGNQPLGPWRTMWSHLPRYLKVEFFSVFQEGQRIDAKSWGETLRRYGRDLEKGFLSSEVFPTSYKGISKHAEKQFGLKARPGSRPQQTPLSTPQSRGAATQQRPPLNRATNQGRNSPGAVKRSNLYRGKRGGSFGRWLRDLFEF